MCLPSGAISAALSAVQRAVQIPIKFKNKLGDPSSKYSEVEDTVFFVGLKRQRMAGQGWQRYLMSCSLVVANSEFARQCVKRSAVGVENERMIHHARQVDGGWMDN